MENTGNQKSRLSETLILVIVLLCVGLILADLTGNVVHEIQADRQSEAAGTAAPTKPVPALPGGATPTPIRIIGWHLGDIS